MGGFLLGECMKDFFLNFTKIVETNPRIYWSIIFGIAACLLLFIAEIVHVDQVISALNTKDRQILNAAIEPITQKYQWSRILVMVMAIFWANWEYLKAKKKLGLSR